MAVVLILFFWRGSILAHHGTAAYDMAKSLTLKGVVTSFEFINPHAEIHVAVTDENGRTVNWLAETNNPNRLARRGWNRNVLKTGDVITIVGNPVKSGAPSLRLTKVVLADGTELDPL
jgi:DNA/RNA endonuclease YhcR with UshA esterase domain